MRKLVRDHGREFGVVQEVDKSGRNLDLTLAPGPSAVSLASAQLDPDIVRRDRAAGDSPEGAIKTILPPSSVPRKRPVLVGNAKIGGPATDGKRREATGGCDPMEHTVESNRYAGSKSAKMLEGRAQDDRPSGSGCLILERRIRRGPHPTPPTRPDRR